MTYRSQKFRKHTRSKPPIIPGIGDNIDHHVKFLNGGGTGMKAPDTHGICLSDEGHKLVHMLGELRAFVQYGYSLSDVAAIIEASICDYLETVHNIDSVRLKIELLTEWMEREGL